MRVRLVTPIEVSAAELDRRRRLYRALAPGELELDLVNLAGGPAALERRADIERSDAMVAAELAATDPATFDAAMSDCVLDPGIDADAPVPVHGVLRLTGGMLNAARLPWAYVVRNAAIGDELRRQALAYGYGDTLRDGAVLELDVDHVERADAWRAAALRHRDALVAGGARALVVGCSAVAPGDWQPMAAIQPIAVAFRALAALSSRTAAG